MSKKTTPQANPVIPMTYKFGECRIRHDWKRREDSPTRGTEGGAWWISDCERCSSVQIIYTDHRGYRVKERCRILHPDGYKLEAGLVVPDFRVFLLEQIEGERNAGKGKRDA